MMTPYLLIILIGSGAQVYTMPNAKECGQMKEWVDKKLSENPDLPKSITGCFRALSSKPVES